MIYLTFILTLQSEEMTNAGGLQGVNVSHFAFVCQQHGKKNQKKTFRQHLVILFFFFSFDNNGFSYFF